MATSVTFPTGPTPGETNVVFNFNGDYPVGQFANGDWWVVGGAGRTITSITPVCNTSFSGSYNTATTPSGPYPYTNKVINGAVINHGCQVSAKGTLSGISNQYGQPFTPFDSRLNKQDTLPNASTGYGAFGTPTQVTKALLPYDAALNCDPGATGNPISMAVPISITKAVSIITPDGVEKVPLFSDLVTLTVLSSIPAAGSFRPAIATADKSILFNKSSLNYGILPGKDRTLVAARPTLAGAFYQLQRSQALGHTNPLLAENMWPLYPLGNKIYGREYARLFDQTYISLMMDYTQAELEPLYIAVVQFGRDIIGRILEGGIFMDNGGSMMNYKFPAILAALNSNTPSDLAVVDGTQSKAFQEDRTVFQVNALHLAADPSYEPQYANNNGALGYQVGDILTDNDPLFDGTVRGSCTVTHICANGLIGGAITTIGGTEQPGYGGLAARTGTGISAVYNTQKANTAIPYSGGSGTGLLLTLLRVYDRYDASLINSADWGINYTTDGGNPSNGLGTEGPGWTTAYRDICSYGYTGGWLCSLLVTGARAAWNNPIFFEYMDRLWDMNFAYDYVPTGNSGTALQVQAWTAYRGPVTGVTTKLVQTAASNFKAWLKFNVTLSRRTPPAISSFVVTETIAGVKTIKTVVSVSIFGRSIGLTTNTAFGVGNAITITYNQPAINPVKDIYGNLIPSVVGTIIATRGGNKRYARGWQ